STPDTEIPRKWTTVEHAAICGRIPMQGRGCHGARGKRPLSDLVRLRGYSLRRFHMKPPRGVLKIQVTIPADGGVLISVFSVRPLCSLCLCGGSYQRLLT